MIKSPSNIHRSFSILVFRDETTYLIMSMLIFVLSLEQREVASVRIDTNRILTYLKRIMKLRKLRNYDLRNKHKLLN